MKIISKADLKDLNLAWVLGLTIVISAVMVTISVVIFLSSGAYDTVKQISAAADVLQTDLEGIDTSSPIQASDIDEYGKNLRQRVRSLNDTEDFGSPAL